MSNIIKVLNLIEKNAFIELKQIEKTFFYNTFKKKIKILENETNYKIEEVCKNETNIDKWKYKDNLNKEIEYIKNKRLLNSHIRDEYGNIKIIVPLSILIFLSVGVISK